MIEQNKREAYLRCDKNKKAMCESICHVPKLGNSSIKLLNDN